jgi:hypothetical protein
MYDIIHDDTFKEITEVYDYLENFFDFEFRTPGNKDLSFVASTVYELKEKIKTLKRSFQIKNEGYQREFHHFERQKDRLPK